MVGSILLGPPTRFYAKLAVGQPAYFNGFLFTSQGREVAGLQTSLRA